MESLYVLPRLPFLKFRFHLIAQEDARLPSFKGSMLRGAFGHALRKTVCIMPKDQACATCMINRQCANTRLFETLIFEKAPPLLKGIDMAPKPFILDCTDERTQLAKGDRLEFIMCLVGNAIDMHPYVIYAVHRMAKGGMSTGRSRFELLSVEAQTAENQWQSLYNGKTQKLLMSPPPMLPDDPQELPVDQVTLRFITPTRFKTKQQLTMHFTFRELVFKMLRRVLELAHFYQPGAHIDWEFRDFLNVTNAVEITESRLEWKDLHRYSNRQKTDMYLGGFTGEVTLSGPLTPFMPLLRAGEVLHVGKGTTFGLGKVKIILGPGVTEVPSAQPGYSQ